MKRLLCLLLCLAVCITPVLAVADKPANGYVGDYADVLSDRLEQDIVERNQTLFDNTGAQIVVVSVRFMDGLDAESYAYECFNQWGVGSDERDNGLLLVFATRDHDDNGYKRCWVAVGTGLENALSEATLNRWLEDYFYDDFDAGNYDAAVEKFFNAAYSWMESYYAGTEGSSAGGVAPYAQESGGGVAGVLGGLVVFTVFLFVAVVMLIAIGSVLRRGFGHYYHPWYGYYRPFPLFFWRRRRYGPPPPPHIPPGQPPGGGSQTSGGFQSGGTSRGGGAGRRGSGFSTGFRSSSSRSGSSFRSGGGSFRSGGGTRGGGAGRR